MPNNYFLSCTEKKNVLYYLSKCLWESIILKRKGLRSWPEGKISHSRKGTVAGVVMQQQELVVETVHILAEQKSGGPKLLAGTTFKDQPRAHSLQKQGHQLGESTRPNTQAYGDTSLPNHTAFKHSSTQLQLCYTGYFQRTWDQFLVATWKLQSVCKSSPRGPDVLVWPSWAIGMCLSHRHTSRQHKHTKTNKTSTLYYTWNLKIYT